MTLPLWAGCSNRLSYLPVLWRRKWDSNPRYVYPYNGFRNRRLKPLGHSSKWWWQDSNLWRRTPTGLQPVPFDHIREPLPFYFFTIMLEDGVEPPIRGFLVHCSTDWDIRANGWGERDSNPYLPIKSRSILPLNYLPKKKWSWRRDSNPWPADYESAALPTELRQQMFSVIKLYLSLFKMSRPFVNLFVVFYRVFKKTFDINILKK